jgi:phage recombination protein Bet
MSKAVTKAIETAAAEYFTPAQVALIKRQIAPGASDDELKMFIADCQRSRLDPFARQIYSIERKEKFYDKASNQWRWRTKRVTQYSIDGFRLIAERTGEYAGQLGPEWCGDDGIWHDVWIADKPPAAARVAALRKDFEKPMWTPAAFHEYCPRNDKGEPTGQWAKMPSVMIAKCAEALALRRAFPNELSGHYTGDEMMQAERDVTPPRPSLAEEMADEIPHNDHAEPTGSLSGTAAPAASDRAAAAGAPLALEDMAREAARRGSEQLQIFFSQRTSAEKKRLRAIEAELITLYPEGDY